MGRLAGDGQLNRSGHKASAGLTRESSTPEADVHGFRTGVADSEFEDELR